MVWLGENFGFALKALARRIEPSRPAFLHGDRTITWAEFDSLTDSIAAGLLERGLQKGDVAGQMLRNSPEYLLSFFGCAKAGVTPVNVNYHYKDRELSDIFARFDLKALFVDAEDNERAASAMPKGALAPITAAPGDPQWDALTSTQPGEGFAPCDDVDCQYFMATGGTTGLPKAVMWPFRSGWFALNVPSWPLDPEALPHVCASLDEHIELAVQLGPDHEAATSPVLCLCPLMHGTAQYTALTTLMKGGTIATMPGAKFDPNAVIDTIRDRRIRTLIIVGDAFALPLVEALEARADASDAIASLRVIGSSGAIFSQSNKERLIAVNRALMISDVLGSSESGGTAIRITSAEGTTGGGNFEPSPGRELHLFDEHLNEILPGSDGVGIVARAGPLPLGYLGEDKKNAETFPEIDGIRYLMTGDRARWTSDGTLEFIGRDNMCINTGGEKVFPEEVEAVLQEHDRVHDVRVVSLPDARFGRKVVAVVQPEGDCDDLSDALDGCAREGLADYKVPRAYFFTDGSLRLNNGKPDYKTAQAIADEGSV